MGTLHHEIQIAAPVEQVWQILSDLPAVRFYNPTVIDSRFASEQQTGIGAARQCDLKPKGKIKERVYLWEPNCTLGLEVAESDYPMVFMRWRTDLTPHQGGTRLSQDMEYKIKFGPIGWLMDRLMMRRMLDKSVGEILTALKHYAETNGTAT